MDDISRGVGAALEAVKEIPSLLDRILGTLDKYHYLPMSDRRGKNLRDNTQIKLELDEQVRNHQRIMDMLDAELCATTALMKGAAQLAIEAAQKEIANGASCEDAFQRCLPFAARAISNARRDILEHQYSRERIGLYALQAAAENPDAKCAEGEVSETWSAQFWDYAKNIRDEEAMQQWGRLLATEVQSPGSIPIKALDTLRALTPKQAKDFYVLQKYALSGTIPIMDITLEATAPFGINVYDISILESISLIITGKALDIKKDIEVRNKFFRVKIPGGNHVRCMLLTEVGVALHHISNNSEEDALAGATYFADYLKKHHGITVEIEKISG